MVGWSEDGRTFRRARTHRVRQNPSDHRPPTAEERAFFVAADHCKALQDPTRIYDGLASGRSYVQSDPIGIDAGVNTYAYVDDDPLRTIDASGLCPEYYDSGWFAGSIQFFAHSPTFSQCELYQQRNRLTGILLNSSGNCDCDKKMTCIYEFFDAYVHRSKIVDCKKRAGTAAWSD